MGNSRRPRLFTLIKLIGPGLVLAAGHVGNLVTSAVAGSRYGLALLWAVAIGALLKYYLSEGVARWQVSTGTTLFEGWVEHFGRWVQYVFLIYLVFWSVIAGGAVITACGLAAHSFLPFFSVPSWGIIHSLVAALCSIGWSYRRFEKVMELFVGLMFVTLCGCAFFITPIFQTVHDVIVQTGVPLGSSNIALGIIGGVGGSLTLLSYGYWIREHGWEGRQFIPVIRVDLAATYIITALFGIASMILAAQTMHAGQVQISGTEGALKLSSLLGHSMGTAGEKLYLFGFWAAASSSLLGSWQSIPYLFCDFVGTMKRITQKDRGKMLNSHSPWYRGYLIYLTLCPIPLLFYHEPISIILLFTWTASFFIPFLAATLLIMNSKAKWVGAHGKSKWSTQVILVVTLILFVYLCASGILGLRPLA